MCCQIRAQPLLLGRAGLTATYEAAIAIDHNDMPGAQIVAVEALGRIASGGPKIGEVARRARRLVLVIAGCWAGARLMPAPCRIITGVELIERTIGIGVIAGGKDRASNHIQQLG